MPNRQIILNEYFQLVLKLNRANKVSDLPTSLEFEIKTHNNQLQFQAKITGPGECSYLILAQLGSNHIWIPSEYTEFMHLENFISNILNELYLSEKDPLIVCHYIKNLFAELLTDKKLF